MTGTTVGALGSPHQVHVDARGRVAPHDHDWSLDWWVGADDHWHIPAREPTVRQSLVDAAPVTRTALRVPHGDAVQHVYGVGGPGDPVVIEVTNESPAPFVLALVISGAHRVEVDGTTVAVDGHPTLWLTRPPSRWAASTDNTTQAQVRAGDARGGPFVPQRDRHGRLEVALLHPVAHRTRLRSALRLDGDPPVQLSPKDLDEVGILGKRRRKADAIVTIPRGFDLLQDSLDDLLACCHDCPPEFYPHRRVNECYRDFSPTTLRLTFFPGQR